MADDLEDEFFRTLVARSRDAIVSIDEESHILFANDGVERVLGYDPEELEGDPLVTIMPDRFHDRHLAAVDRYLSEGERTLDWNDIELPAQHADGHEVPLSIVFEEYEHQGRTVFTGIMRDISDRIEREEWLERQNEQLEQFASVLSHDLRDPLNTAQATLSLLRAAGDPADETMRYADDLSETFDRMETLIEGVLELARSGGQVVEREPVDLETVAGEAWRTIAAPGATLVDATDDTVVEADSERLQALLENLFRNAVQHGADDDGVRVTVGALDGREGFYVADDGRGIPPDERDTVFERGHTTDEQEGVGLGLSIVRTVAQGHGWTVSVTESDAGGARFEFVTAD